MLTEDKRLQLDRIVGQMAQNGEQDADIQFVVNDFKRLHDTPAPQPSLKQAGKNALDVVAGIGQSVGNLAYGVAKIGQKIANPVERALGVKQTEIGPQPEILKAKNQYQEVGQLAGETLQFLLPGGMITKAQSAAKGAIAATKFTQSGKTAATIGSRALIEGGTSGAIRTAQTGGNLEEGATGAKWGAAVPVAGDIVSRGTTLFGRIAKSFGSKIQDAVIKPSIRDVKDGFRIENVAKYGVGGSLNDTLKKTTAKMNDLAKQLAANARQNPDVRIDLNEAFEETVKRVDSGKAKMFGTAGRTESAVAELKDEIARFGQPSVDLSTATTIKRAAGTQGAWAYGIPDPSAKARESVYDMFYNVLKTKIEKASPPGVNEINRQLGDLIPIHNAVVRRIPVAERNNAIGLEDAIGLFIAAGNPGVLPLVITNKLTKSGKVGNALTKVGENIVNRQPSKTTTGKRIFGK